MVGELAVTFAENGMKKAHRKACTESQKITSRDQWCSNRQDGEKLFISKTFTSRKLLSVPCILPAETTLVLIFITHFHYCGISSTAARGQKPALSSSK